MIAFPIPYVGKGGEQLLFVGEYIIYGSRFGERKFSDENRTV